MEQQLRAQKISATQPKTERAAAVFSSPGLEEDASFYGQQVAEYARAEEEGADVEGGEEEGY